MKNIGETKMAPGSRLMPIGIALLALSVALLVMNLTSKIGKPSAAFWILLLTGAICAGVGFGRRVLNSR